jgi:hypothetical protein
MYRYKPNYVRATSVTSQLIGIVPVAFIPFMRKIRAAKFGQHWNSFR